jgi:DNA-binding response OmpR family regulator
MRILIANADDFEARIYVRAFKTRLFEADVVGDGDACLAEARTHRPDVIVLDLVLPHRGGFAVLEGLCADERTSRIPVVVLARAARSHDVERTTVYGSYPFFIKPFARPDAIVQYVEALMKQVRCIPS